MVDINNLAARDTGGVGPAGAGEKIGGQQLAAVGNLRRDGNRE